jgi:hypothetical protein
MHLRAVLRKSLSELVKDKTVVSVKLETLRKMVRELTLVVLETTDRDVELKLIYLS